MAGESLFERLRSARNATSKHVADEGQSRIRSVMLNLQNLLNSWAGHAPAQMELGIPAPSEIAHNYPSSIGEVLRAIKTCIEKYEPRLADVRVIYIESDEDRLDLQLRFKIEARLLLEKGSEKVSFDTLVNHAGDVRLQS